MIFLTFNNFLKILVDFDFRIFPIFMPFFWFWLTCWRFYAILSDFRRFWFSNLSHFIWFLSFWMTCWRFHAILSDSRRYWFSGFSNFMWFLLLWMTCCRFHTILGESRRYWFSDFFHFMWLFWFLLFFTNFSWFFLQPLLSIVMSGHFCMFLLAPQVL